MNKTFKKITVSIMAVTTLAVSIVGMSANASNPDYWSLHRYAGAPSSSDVFSHTGAVTGLSAPADMGVAFVKTAFSDSGNNGVRAKCDIQSDIKRITNQYAYISASTSTSTCLFKDGWETIDTDGIVNYSVTIVDYKGYGFVINGYAH